MRPGRYRSEVEISSSSPSSSRSLETLYWACGNQDFECYIHLPNNGTIECSLKAVSIPGTLTESEQSSHVEKYTRAHILSQAPYVLRNYDQESYED